MVLWPQNFQQLTKNTAGTTTAQTRNKYLYIVYWFEKVDLNLSKCNASPPLRIRVKRKQEMNPKLECWGAFISSAQQAQRTPSKQFFKSHKQQKKYF